jgi:hypothetical protein
VLLGRAQRCTTPSRTETLRATSSSGLTDGLKSSLPQLAKSVSMALIPDILAYVTGTAHQELLARNE